MQSIFTEIKLMARDFIVYWLDIANSVLQSFAVFK